jgi:hypothetical protein
MQGTQTLDEFGIANICKAKTKQTIDDLGSLLPMARVSRGYNGCVEYHGRVTMGHGNQGGGRGGQMWPTI